MPVVVWVCLRIHVYVCQRKLYVKALFALSFFLPLFPGVFVRPAQANNAYVFPALVSQTLPIVKP
jgi:hypothetical protein